MLAYLIAGIAALGLLAGVGYKVRQTGYESCKMEWAESDKKIQADVEAEKARLEALRAKQDQQATKRLSDARKQSAALYASLEAHIKASGAAANCPLPSSLLDDWNKANQGKGTGAMPPAR
jgi:hypothetical protein